MASQSQRRRKRAATTLALCSSKKTRTLLPSCSPSLLSQPNISLSSQAKERNKKVRPPLSPPSNTRNCIAQTLLSLAQLSPQLDLEEDEYNLTELEDTQNDIEVEEDEAISKPLRFSSS